jgi:small subunit ribosomal protein S16
MVRIRLKRLGRKKSPFYRVVVMNKRDRRNGRPIEEIGFYDPMSKQLKLDKAAALAWIAKGAQPSETVAGLIKLAAEDGSLVQLTKKDRKEHAGEANQIKPVVAEVAKAEETDASIEDVPAAEAEVQPVPDADALADAVAE